MPSSGEASCIAGSTLSDSVTRFIPGRSKLETLVATWLSTSFAQVDEPGLLGHVRKKRGLWHAEDGSEHRRLRRCVVLDDERVGHDGRPRNGDRQNTAVAVVDPSPHRSDLLDRRHLSGRQGAVAVARQALDLYEPCGKSREGDQDDQTHHPDAPVRRPGGAPPADPLVQLRLDATRIFQGCPEPLFATEPLLEPLEEVCFLGLSLLFELARVELAGAMLTAGMS